MPALQGFYLYLYLIIPETAVCRHTQSNKNQLFNDLVIIESANLLPEYVEMIFLKITDNFNNATVSVNEQQKYTIQ
jgi:hypothetical protein